MNGRVFLDTNVLVYAEDTSEPAKREKARGLIRVLAHEESGVLSAQILGEFVAVTTRRFGRELGLDVAEQRVAQYRQAFEVLDTTADVVSEAVRGVRIAGLSFYDAQVWAVTRLNRIGIVLSEDFADGSELEGVRFANPFAPGFDLATWR